MADRPTDAKCQSVDCAPHVAEANESPDKPFFEWTNELRFQWYMERRNGYSAGARDSYQRYDQTIATVSAGAIVLSITFLKDVGFVAPSIPFLYASWFAFLLAGGASLISLRTSADCDIENLSQLERLRNTGNYDGTKAQRVGAATVRLNNFSLGAFVFGILLMMIFAFMNYEVLDRDSGANVRKTQLTTRDGQRRKLEPANTSAAPPIISLPATKSPSGSQNATQMTRLQE